MKDFGIIRSKQFPRGILGIMIHLAKQPSKLMQYIFSKLFSFCCPNLVFIYSQIHLDIFTCFSLTNSIHQPTYPPTLSHPPSHPPHRPPTSLAQPPPVQLTLSLTHLFIHSVSVASTSVLNPLTHSHINQLHSPFTHPLIHSTSRFTLSS